MTDYNALPAHKAWAFTKDEDMKREFDGPPRATDKEIRIAFDRGATVAELAEFLCRSEQSIRAALRRSRA